MGKPKKDKPALTPKQEQFAREYVIDLNATQAAIRAGYSPKTAPAAASRLLTNVKVQELASALRAKTAEKLDITRERIMAEYAKLAFADMADFGEWDEHGNTRLSASKDLGDKTAAVAEITVRDIPGSEDESPSRLIKFKLHPKREALDSICKMQGWFTEKREISGPGGAPLAVAVDLSALSDAELAAAEAIASRIAPAPVDATNHGG
jgi:phage terminase small subunit